MNPDPTENQLADVLEGPWAQKAVDAEVYLAQQRKATLTLNSSSGSSARSGPPNRIRTAELSNVFRAHWHQFATNVHEQQVRNSFDEALNTLQLLELGIETGYYTADQLRRTVVAKFEELFWSEAAVNYLLHHQYIGVRFLAARYEIDLGLPPLPPPAPNPDAGVRYATFLSIYAEFYHDSAIKSCLHFLSDRTQFPDEQRAFAEFLTKKVPQTSSEPIITHFQHLSKGFYKVILYLNDVFKVVERTQEKSFALFFSYWLMRFTGYQLTDSGYHATGENWAALISRSPNQLLLASGYASAEMSAKDAAPFKQLLRQRIRSIQQAWFRAKTEIETRASQ
ncbi:MAG TPA: hypothetical protein VF598_08910 [Hymenobacter sp.]|jgi:hypothetical protein